jgi:hypothetical protein
MLQKTSNEISSPRQRITTATAAALFLGRRRYSSPYTQSLPQANVNDDDQHFVTQSKQSKNQETTTLSSLFSSCLCLQK